jgi:Ca-activated chloride channel family protein
MALLDPIAGLAGLSLAAIVALYFLRARRPTHQVPSTLWWHPITLDRQAAAPWQRLHPSWLLLLQLLAAGLVVAALLQPALATAQALSGQTVVIIDTSATMQATDVRPSRFGVAVADARALVGRLGPQARMTLIAMGPSPRVIATANGDRQLLDEALSGLRPSDGSADLQDALQLAVATAGPHPRATRLVILSDGITQPLSEPVTLPFPVEYRKIGVSGENTGVTALSVVAGVTGEEAVAHVQDFGQVVSHVTAEMFANGRLADARSLHLAPHAGQDVGFAVPPGTTTVRVELVPHDEYPLDQVAVATAPTPERVRILLVSTGDLFLQDALALRPGAQVVTETPSVWRPSQASDPAYDLFVFEGFVPAKLPVSAPYLVVGPPPARSLGTGRALSPGPLVPAQANDPLLYDVDLANVDVAASADMAYSHFGNVVVTSAGGPVLMVRPATASAPAAALLGAYLHDSNFVLRSAFPILLMHLSQYLAPGTVPAPTQQPGTPVTIAPPPGATRVSVTVPGERTRVIWQSKKISPGTLLFEQTGEPGLYRVEVTQRDGASATSYFAVDVPGQSISPQPSLQVTGTASKAVAASSTFQSFWPWLAAAALAVLIAEWVVYHRAG